MFLTACDPTLHKKHFNIEQDGKVGRISFSEFNSEGINLTTGSSLSEEQVQSEVLRYGNELKSDTPISRSHQQLAIDNNFVVNNQIYNFYFSIPIKSKTDIFKLPLDSEQLDYTFYIERCDAPYEGGQTLDVFNPSLKVTKDQAGYYHYTLYRASKSLASTYQLNSISNLCLKYEYRFVGSVEVFSGDSYDIKSNEITIKAKEIEDILDDLGIAH
jgi:hypothetical protein